MVAAYLVGTRGTPRHAVALGAIVTVTHTAGVFALGVVALALSSAVLPEDLLPWLELASGLLVLGVGAAVLRRHLRRRAAVARVHHHHDHHDDNAHAHDGHEHHHDGTSTTTTATATCRRSASPPAGCSRWARRPG